MKNSSNKCSTCYYLDRYYTKGANKYNAVKFGWCRNKGRIVTTAESCCEYEAKPKIPRLKRHTRLLLADMLAELASIRSILEEENNEDA